MCENFKGVLKSEVTDSKRFLAYARCKMWRCAYCATANRAKWRAIITDYINKNPSDYSWFTITANERTHKGEFITERTYINLAGGFSKLIKRMRRQFKNDIFYVRVYEQHKSGALHIHCICNVKFGDIVTRNKGKKNEYTDSLWLRKSARSCGLGYMTHAADIEQDKRFVVIGYVTKYMTKENLERVPEGKNIRRIQSSRHISFNQQTDSELTWILTSGYYIDQYEDDLKENIEVFSFMDNKTVNYDDFIDTFVYPK